MNEFFTVPKFELKTDNKFKCLEVVEEEDLESGLEHSEVIIGKQYIIFSRSVTVKIVEILENDLSMNLDCGLVSIAVDMHTDISVHGELHIQEVTHIGDVLTTSDDRNDNSNFCSENGVEFDILSIVKKDSLEEEVGIIKEKVVYPIIDKFTCQNSIEGEDIPVVTDSVIRKVCVNNILISSGLMEKYNCVALGEADFNNENALSHLAEIVCNTPGSSSVGLVEVASGLTNCS